MLRRTISFVVAIALIGSGFGLLGKLVTGQVPLGPSLALVAGALPAARLGSAASRRAPIRTIRIILAVIVALVAVKMWIGVLR